MQSTPWLLFPYPENLIRLRRGRGERGTVLCLRLCLRLCLEAVSGGCQEPGIFQTFSLLFFTTFYVALPLHTLFSQFHSSKKRQDACY